MQSIVICDEWSAMRQQLDMMRNLNNLDRANILYTTVDTPHFCNIINHPHMCSTGWFTRCVLQIQTLIRDIVAECVIHGWCDKLRALISSSLYTKYYKNVHLPCLRAHMEMVIEMNDRPMFELLVELPETPSELRTRRNPNIPCSQEILIPLMFWNKLWHLEYMVAHRHYTRADILNMIWHNFANGYGFDYCVGLIETILVFPGIVITPEWLGSTWVDMCIIWRNDTVLSGAGLRSIRCAKRLLMDDRIWWDIAAGGSANFIPEGGCGHSETTTLFNIEYERRRRVLANTTATTIHDELVMAVAARSD